MAQDCKQERIARFQRDIDYFEAHRQELIQQYPDQWIVIFNQELVGNDADLEQLLQRLNQAGVPIEKALIENVSAEEEALFLVFMKHGLLSHKGVFYPHDRC